MKAKQDNYWIVLADLMTILMVIFLFIAVTNIKKVNDAKKKRDQIISDYKESKVALKRELFEELNITTDIKSKFITVVHQYPDFELTIHGYICGTQK